MSEVGQGFVDEWWARIRAGEKLVQRCRRCGELQLHPRRRCNTCSGAELTFEAVSGDASLYTFTTIFHNPPSRFIGQTPYTLGIVRLREGPRMLARLVGADPATFGCDMRLRWTLAKIGDEVMPCFEPA
ncbi:MAG: Zn-ribbon domain-containing OB-fold protein [Lautropia sp.]